MNNIYKSNEHLGKYLTLAFGQDGEMTVMAYCVDI